MADNRLLSSLRQELYEPSEQKWRDICALLEEEGIPDAVTLTYLVEHLESWPQELRVAPSQWVLSSAPEVRELLGLARSVSFYLEDIGDDLARALATNPAATGLTRVFVERCGIRAPGMEALAGSPHLEAVREFAISHMRLTAAYPAFVSSALASNLTWLSLGWSGVDNQAVGLMATASGLAEVARLNLAGNDFTDAGLGALGRSEVLRSVRELDLSHNSLSDQGLAAFVRSPLAARLESLDMSWMDQGGPGIHTVTAIVETPEFRPAVRFEMTGAGLDDALRHRLEELDWYAALHPPRTRATAPQARSAPRWSPPTEVLDVPDEPQVDTLVHRLRRAAQWLLG